MWRRVVIQSTVLALLLAGLAAAQPGPGERPLSNRPLAEKGKIGKNRPAALIVTPEREAAVMAFVKQHHPELSELLIQLKEGNAQQYEQAVRELFRASERLAQVQERDPQQYELDLKLWQAQSRVQLLSARVKMSDSRELRMQLRAALQEQHESRLAVLRSERDRLQARMEDIDQQLQRLEEGRQQAIERRIQSLIGPKPARPAGKKNNVKSSEEPK
jgi:hypothetical protein